MFSVRSNHLNVSVKCVVTTAFIALTASSIATAQTPSKLGPELSCVEQGLRDAGHSDVSDRYLALLGTVVQAQHGPFRTDDPEAFQSRVIQMIESNGYCDTSSYKPLTDNEVTQVQRLLSADKGSAMGKSGHRYISAAASEESEKVMVKLFGIGKADHRKSDFSVYFKHDSKKWDRLSPADRRKIWLKKNDRFMPSRKEYLSMQLDPNRYRLVNQEKPMNTAVLRAPNRTYNDEGWNSCRRNAIERISEKGSAWEIESRSKDAKANAACVSMANACGISVATCSGTPAQGSSATSGKAPRSGSQESVK